MVSARGEEEDRIKGLDTRADDYITKPFSSREPAARVNAVLRRVKPRKRTDQADQAFSRPQLLDQVCGNQIYVEERTVDAHVRRLRKVLEPTKHDYMLQTVRGVGYRFSNRV